MDCIDRFIKFINKNAYIQIALSSKNFCQSAMEAFILILKHAGKFAVVSGLGGIFMLLGKMTIASVTTFLGFIIIDNWPAIRDELQSQFAPLIVIFLIAYVVGAVFISVYSTSTDAILQCFLVDTDIAEQ